MIYWMASYPRSGNTFFRILLKTATGLDTYSLYNDPIFEEIGASDTIGHKPLPAALPELRRQPEPYFVKTHHLPGDELPAVYLVRDGRDSLVSYAKFLQAFNPQIRMVSRLCKRLGIPHTKILLRQIITGAPVLERVFRAPLFGGWNRNVQAWPARPEGPTFVIRYEDLCREPERLLGDALESLGIGRPSSTAAAPAFESLQARWPNFFRKGKIGAWQEEFTPELHDLFWKHHAEGMRLHGYSRD